MSSIDLSHSAKADSGTPRTSAGWRVLCISPNADVRKHLIAVVAQGLPAAVVLESASYPEIGDLPGAFGLQAPNIVFLDVITNQTQALSLMPEIAKLNRGINTVALLAANEPQLILKCLRSGAAGFLLQPFTAEQLEASLSKLERTLPKERQAPKQTGKVVCVVPAKGACGASTLASNLAFHTKRAGANRVLLADLDPLTGIISFLLKIKSTYSFMDVLSHSDGLDADLWKAMITPRQGVDVLLSPEVLFEGSAELRDASPVIDYARTNYDVAFLDAPSVYGEWNLSQAKLCDELILVTTNELPALQATQRALSYLDANRVGRWKVRVVVNRYDKDVGLSREVIGTALHTDVFHVIPSDYEAVQKSLLEGKPIPHTSTLGRSFATLGERLSGKKKEPVKNGTSSLGSLLSLFSRTSS
jgi:pilus assembly protein CpaE